MNAVVRRLELTRRQNKRSGPRSRSEPSANATVNSRDFQSVYDHAYEDVVRWIRALGGPSSEQDDLIQDGDPTEVAHVSQPRRQLEILPRWFGSARRVVMHEDNGCRRAPNTTVLERFICGVRVTG
jgi:hypothetical protein